MNPIKKWLRKYRYWKLNRQLKRFESYLEGASRFNTAMINQHIKKLKRELNELD